MDRKLIRFTVYLPINENTKNHIDEIITSIAGEFRGFTYSNYYLPALRIFNHNTKQSQEIKACFTGVWKGIPEPVITIIIDIDILTNPNAPNKVTEVVRNIKSSGEEAVWAVYHDATLDYSGI